MDLPPKPCAKIGCRRRATDARRRYCDEHAALHAQREAKRKRSRIRTAAQSMYNSQWRKARGAYLNRNPLCVVCGLPGDHVDHVEPHLGDVRLFWDRGNWQTLCKSCHSRKTSRSDGGFGNPRRSVS